MFKKLLSNLPFNPSLIGQVSFYSRRLRAEGSVRKMGFAFMILSLLVQGFAVIAPSEPTYANPDNDVFRGGFRDQAHMVNSCNDNAQQFKKILAYFDVSCTDLFFGDVRRIDYAEHGGNMYSMGRISYFGNDKAVNIPSVGRFYMRPLTNWGAHCYDDGANCMAVTGERPDGTPFWVLFSCGNIVIYGPPTPPPPPEEPPVVPPPPPPEEPEPKKVIACDALIMNIANKSTVEIGTSIRTRGRATGRNTDGKLLGAKSLVDMYYEYVDASNGKVLGRQTAKGVKFDDGVARDSTARIFTVKKAGKFNFRLAVKYREDGVTKNASGNNRGGCVKQVSVEVSKPCDEAEDEDDLYACLELHKSVTNETQGIEDANGTEAKAGDVLIYTLSVTNTSTNKTIEDFVVEENIADILEYSDVVDLYGGTLGEDKIVRWPAADIQPGKTIEQKLKVKVKDPIPQTPVSANNPWSFDLLMTNVYGDTITIDLPPNPPKLIEKTTQDLPNTGPGETLAVAFVVTVGAGYFFARSRLMSKELDIVRSDYAAGGV